MNIKIASIKEELDACLAVRRIVFIQEQNVPEDLEVDGDDPKCTHILVELNGNAIGAARYQHIGDSVKIQRVAVLTEHRGKSVGAKIINFIIDQLRKDGKAKFAKLGSQSHAIAFYEKLGFITYGDEYLDAGIPHRDMKLKL